MSDVDQQQALVPVLTSDTGFGVWRCVCFSCVHIADGRLACSQKVELKILESRIWGAADFGRQLPHELRELPGLQPAMS